MAPGEVPAVFPDKRPLSGHLIHPKIHTISYFQALLNVQNSSINVLLVFSTASLVLSEYVKHLNLRAENLQNYWCNNVK